MSPAFADIHKGFFRQISGESEPQGTIAGDLVFMGENAYADYRAFVNWCAGSEELYLVYKPYGNTEFYRKVCINYLTKTELTDTRWLSVPMSLACMTPWYRAAPSKMAMSTEEGNIPRYPFCYAEDLIYSSSNAGSMAVDLGAAGHIPAAFVIQYSGAIINPKITLQGSSTGKTYGVCALELTLAEDERLEISSRYGNSYARKIDSTGHSVDVLENVDLAYDPFPRIPVSEDCTLYLSADETIRGSATVRVYYYYRSV